MAKSAIELYNELLTEEPIIHSLIAAAALRVTLDQYRDGPEPPPEVEAFLERFMENLDKLGDEVLPE